jgi:serine/threonine-protein kinase
MMTFDGGQTDLRNRSIVACMALGITLAGVAIALLLSAPQLPARVASHFNGAGAPDGWMSRGAYLWLMAGIGFGMTAFLVGVFYSIRFFPPSTINMPRRDYWLAEERRQETFAFIFRAGVWLATFDAALLLGIHLLVVSANAAQPVRMSSQVWWLVGGFFLAIVGWAYWLIQGFRRVED